MRKYLSTILGVIILVLGVVIFNLINRKSQEETTEKEEKIVEVTTTQVQLQDLPYVFEATGTLQATEKVEIYSEVQGVLQPTKTPFKIGNSFRKGQVLISINSDEHRAQIKSTRSDFINQLAMMLPDMEIDYPNSYKKWEAYLKSLEVTELVPKLPEPDTNQEKLFISGKNIFKTYYNVKNLEERLSKYYITAPFSGVITASNVEVGTLIRSGQNIGEIINDSSFELHISIPATENKYLIKGANVDLQTLDKSQNFVGKITRINGKVNQETQTVKVVVAATSETFKDGQYLIAKIKGNDLKDVFIIDNELILENNKVYVVNGNKLALKEITVVNYQNDKALVKGLQNNDVLVIQTVANAYPGMKVKLAQ